MLYTSYVSAQNVERKIDSLLNQANKEVIETRKINALSEALELSNNSSNYEKEEESLLSLVEVYKGLNIKDQVFSYSLMLESLYESKGDYVKLAKENFYLGEILFDLELYLKSKSYFLQLEKYFYLIDDVDLKQKTLKYLGDISSVSGSHDEAIVWYKKSLQQSKKEFNVKMTNTLYQLIGLEYKKSGHLNEGINYHNRILGQLPLDYADSVRGVLHNNIGVLYGKKGEVEKADANFNEAIFFIPVKTENADILAKITINLAIIQQKTGRQDEALESIQRAEYYCGPSENEKLKNQVSFVTSKIYFYMEDFHNALLYVDMVIDNSMIIQDDRMTASAMLFKSKIFGEMGNHELERDFKSSYLEKESEITNEGIMHEALLNSTRINIEQIEKDALVYQKKKAEELAYNESRNAELEAQKAKESQIMRDQALSIAQHEIDKNIIFEIEKDAALNKAKRDSLTAVNALVQEEIAKQKSISDSIKTVFALQKQHIAQREANNAKDVINRSRLIGILLFIILLIIIIGLLYQRRLNTQISLEKEKSDSLLLNILPVRVANELKHNSKVAPRKYDNVSVLFTDFVGFTKIAEEMSEDKLIEELDRYFNIFDNIMEKHNLEKIKTIGDSYMCAGGVPQRNATNALDAVNAGLEIAEFMKNDKNEKKKLGIPYWGIRIGVNTGPVIAGVVGSKKFAYDIWGDTVNIASRIESSGLEGYVNVSESTYKLVNSKFECVSRGMIIAKNKGPVPMFYVKDKL
ncbi:MAG: hypothetical protein KAH10_06820 [Flavobacteriales bacterium]|nr:hypothetical protein [Flavobacteriales bacterium]